MFTCSYAMEWVNLHIFTCIVGLKLHILVETSVPSVCFTAFFKFVKHLVFINSLFSGHVFHEISCFDRSKEAMSMYSKLKNHPNSEISKKANMFMFSFQVSISNAYAFPLLTKALN